jgi:hypothetical protein
MAVPYICIASLASPEGERVKVLKGTLRKGKETSALSKSGML